MKRALLLVLAIAACEGERRPEAKALELYEEGKEQLERGEYAAAAERFRLASERDPQRPVLRSWQAYAVAAGGDPDAAIALLETEGVAGLSPHDRYNMAAWHARQGRPESAMPLLEAALEDEPELRESLAEDPDFASLLEQGVLAARLEDRALRAVMLGEEGAILAGELYDLELTVQPSAAQLGLEWAEPLPHGFVLERVIDDRADEQGGPGSRTLRYRLRARQGGEGSLGPWALVAGEQRVDVAEVPWQALVPAGVELGEAPSLQALQPSWWTPREALDGLGPTAASSLHGLLVVGFLPGDRVEVDPAAVAGGPLDIELREDDQAVLLARAWRWAPDASGAAVTIIRGGGRVLDTTVERGD